MMRIFLSPAHSPLAHYIGHTRIAAEQTQYLTATHLATPRDRGCDGGKPTRQVVSAARIVIAQILLPMPSAAMLTTLLACFSPLWVVGLSIKPRGPASAEPTPILPPRLPAAPRQSHLAE